MLALSWIAAVLACLGYGVGSVLQSVGAQRTAHVSGVSGFALIVLQGPYLLGLAADCLAFVANVVALQRLPLFLVQSILTASVGVTAVLATFRGTRLSGRDWSALAVLAAGLVLLSVSASSENAVQVSATAQYAILASCLAPLAVGLTGTRLGGRRSGVLLALAAGAAFSGVAVASRGISGARLDWSLLAQPLVWTIAVQGVLGLVFFALALQRASVTIVTAVTFLVEMLAPSVVGLLLFGDTVHGGYAPVAALGFALSIVGTGFLTRYAE